MAESVLGLRDGLTPPRKAIFETGGKFETIGNEFLQYFIDIGELKPHERVLDIGCGIGRMAIPLTTYLSKKGEFHGFDIVREWIKWCNNNISTRHQNFHFQWSDIYNGKYNPTGKMMSSKYSFPFKDGYFHFAFATSVFTHMFPDDVKNYLSEITRVLKSGGRCLLTFFLLNEKSKELLRAGASSLNFAYKLDSCFTVDESEPETALAYDESLIRDLHEKNGLRISEPISYGSWSGRDTFLSYQDIVLAYKI